jgi:hypothetical protein
MQPPTGKSDNGAEHDDTQPPHQQPPTAIVACIFIG